MSLTFSDIVRDGMYREFVLTFGDVINEFKDETYFSFDECVDILNESDENYNNCDPSSGQRVFTRANIEEFLDLYLKLSGGIVV